jgi:hypothetical protein
MQKIYEVSETIQQSDSDAWAHWLEHEQISLHSSLEGAERKIQFLLNKEIDKIPRLKKLNPDFPEKHWEEEKDLLERNRGYFTQATNGGGYREYPLYTIKEITIED